MIDSFLVQDLEALTASTADAGSDADTGNTDFTDLDLDDAQIERSTHDAQKRRERQRRARKDQNTQPKKKRRKQKQRADSAADDGDSTTPKAHKLPGDLLALTAQNWDSLGRSKLKTASKKLKRYKNVRHACIESETATKT